MNLIMTLSGSQIDSYEPSVSAGFWFAAWGNNLLTTVKQKQKNKYNIQNTVKTMGIRR